MQGGWMNVTGRVSTARRLRQSQTDAERVLWLRLRDRRLNGLKFRRQVPIDRYVVDFFCAEAHLVIEVDGGQHATADETNRTKFLEAMGYLVLRFWNNEVHENLEGVLESILNVIDRSEPPHPTPLPCGERESNRRVR
jgi:very-short-patch-repair endonuclease